MAKARWIGHFTFHHVGQGLFYSGKIDLPGKTINIVYDCGSFFDNALLEKEIECSFRTNENIDLLMISHMDEDHISGLDYLLQRVNGIEFVIMPYLEPAELIFLAAKYSSPRRRKTHENYIGLLRNFFDVLNNRKIKNIIMLTNEVEEQSEYLKIDTPTDGISVKFKINKNKQKEFDKNISSMSRPFRNDVQIAQHDGELRCYDAWVFRYYVSFQDSQKRKKFRSILKKMGIKIDSFTSVRDAINHHKQKLKNAYKKISYNLNLTSMVVLHYPVICHDDSSTLEYEFLHLMCGCCINGCYHMLQSFRNEYKTLLLGDANMKRVKDCVSLQAYFGKDLEQCGIALVPHHGSKYNWHSRVLERIKSPLWVVSFGIHGKYGHPDTEVLNDFLCGWEYVHGYKRCNCCEPPLLLVSNEYRSVNYLVSVD